MYSSNVDYDIEQRTVTKYRQATIVAFILMLLFLIGFAVMLGLYINEKKSNHNANEMTTTSTMSSNMTTTMSPETYPDWMYKLPKTAIPIDYYIIIETSLPPAGGQGPPVLNGSFNGSVQIDAQMIADTDNITLNIEPNYLKLDPNNPPHLINTNEVRIVNYTYNDILQMVTFKLSSPLYIGQNLTLVLTILGTLRSDAYGFYLSSYADTNNNIQYLASTQMETTEARSVIPCFDEPEYKATFRMNLVHDKSLLALSNMDVMGQSPSGNGKIMTTFNTTPKMSSYLLAFFIGQFNCSPATVSKTKNLVKIRVCARPEFIQQTKLAQEYGALALAWYENYFNVPFPLDKLDLLAVPQFGPGAMENWGLIIFREKYLLYDSTTFAKTASEGVLTTVVHEIAHMWFGDLVTMRWWNDIWLNEAFASMMEFYAGDPITNGSMNLASQVPLMDTQPSMQIDQQPTSHPINYMVYTNAQINSMFDDITYGKGACILQMLMNTLVGVKCNETDSEVIFRNGIQKYLSSMAYSNADHNDLFYFLEQAYNESGCKPMLNQMIVSQYLSMWINQMGFPVLISSRNISTNKITIRQNIFQTSNNSVLPASPYNYYWNVYTMLQFFTTDKGQYAPRDLFLPPNNSSTTIDIVSNSSDDFFILSGGYYRVAYDQSNWDAIRKYHLNSNTNSQLSVVQRSQLVDDLMTFAESENSYNVDYKIVFDYLCYLPLNEKSNVVWQTTFSHLTYISMMAGIDSKNRNAFDNYSQWLTADQYKQVESNNNSLPVLYFQQQVLIWDQACRAGNPNCTKNADQYFQSSFMQLCKNNIANNTYCTQNNIPPNLRSSIYCSTMYNSDKSMQQTYYDFLFMQYVGERVNNERLNLLYGMSCATNSTIINRFINESTSDTGAVERTQRVYVFRYLPLNPYAGQIMWPYVVTNWNSLWNSVLSQDGIGDVIMGSTRDLNKPQDVINIQQFIASHQNDAQGFPLAYFNQALSQVQNNVKWTQNYLSNVVTLLANAPTTCMHR